MLFHYHRDKILPFPCSLVPKQATPPIATPTTGPSEPYRGLSRTPGHDSLGHFDSDSLGIGRGPLPDPKPLGGWGPGLLPPGNQPLHQRPRGNRGGACSDAAAAG